jgi:hypothetical protein
MSVKPWRLVVFAAILRAGEIPSVKVKVWMRNQPISLPRVPLDEPGDSCRDCDEPMNRFPKGGRSCRE